MIIRKCSDVSCDRSEAGGVGPWLPALSALALSKKYRTLAICAALFAALSIPLQATDSLTVYEVDGVTQTGRVISFGRATVEGEIASGSCLRPMVGGVAIATNNWQDDIKNAWPNGSRKFGIVSFIAPTFSANSNLAVTFQAGTCNSSGLSQGGMTGFNSGNWSAQFVVKDPTAAATETVDAKTMLTALSNADCQWSYWLQGPVVTQVSLQDCTSASAYDFGALWGAPVASLTGTGNGGSGCTTGNTVSITNTGGIGNGSGALFTATVLGGVITGYVQVSGGLGYMTAPYPPTVSVAQGTCATTPTANPVMGSGVMNLNSGAWYGTNNQYASLHPIFILSFYPSTNVVGVDFVMENEWTGRTQDQKYSFVLKTGSTPTQVYTSTGQSWASSGIFTQLAGTRWHKTFYSGTAPGHIRIDHNFAYLSSTGLLPSYDLVNGGVSPNSVTTLNNNSFPGNLTSLINCPSNTAGDYGCFELGDRGDITGTAMILRAQNPGNDLGEPVRREDLDYLWNMGTCGTVNGLCAEGWALLTGEVDANSSTTLGGVSGGGGMWNAQGNWPWHLRESRTGGSFYCPGYDTANTTASSSCGSGAGNTTGHGISRHAYPTTGQASYGFLAVPVGTTVNSSTFSFEADCSHWTDWAYPAYLLTGSYFELEEVQQGANYCDFAQNPDTAWGDGNGVFVFFNFITGTRYLAWPTQQQAYAATVSPDGTAEQAYYEAVLRSNAGVMEGFYGITGSALTPTSPNSSCSGYAAFSSTPSTATAWDFGHCGHGIGIFPTLHNPSNGACWSADVYTNQQTVTASTSANPSVLTMADTTDIFNNTVNIWGATGAWASFNTLAPISGSPNYGIQATGISGTTVSIPINATGFSQPITGTVQIGDGFIDQTKTTDFQEPWMDSGLTVVINRVVAMGFTAWANIQTQLNDRIVEIVQDAQYNPWLISLYELGIKNGGGSCPNGITQNAYLTSWSAVKSAVIPPFQTLATFDAAQLCSADHSYPLVAMAAASFATNVTDTCSQGSCTGAAAWTWLQAHVPFYTKSVSGSLSCSAGNDIQAPFAFTPATTASVVGLSTGSFSGSSFGGVSK